jgi:hypothetical protein
MLMLAVFSIRNAMFAALVFYFQPDPVPLVFHTRPPGSAGGLLEWKLLCVVGCVVFRCFRAAAALAHADRRVACRVFNCRLPPVRRVFRDHQVII